MWTNKVHTLFFLRLTAETQSICFTYSLLQQAPQGTLHFFELSPQAQLKTNNPFHTLVHSVQFHGTQRLHGRRLVRRNAAALVNSAGELRSWRAAWERESATPPARFLVTPAVCLPTGSELPRSLWVALNRRRTGVGRFGTWLYRWGILDTSKCICGAKEHSANHIIFDCNSLRPPNCLEDLRFPNINSTKWLVAVVKVE